MNSPFYVQGAHTPASSPAEPTPWDETTVVGQPRPRVDAYERVSGSAVYASDVTFPDLLHAAIVRCPHAHARVKRVDTSRAERMPGVRAVLTDSTPGAAIPWYFGEKGPTSRLLDPHCRYEGEEVAAVAAETPHQAWDAARAIAVEYEVLRFVVDEARALEPGVPAIHEGGNRVSDVELYERGDVAAGFAEADFVVELAFRTQCEIHAPMEVHGSVARWDGNRLTVWDTTQGVFEIQRILALAFGLPQSSVRVVSPYMGGGFGSKLELGKYTVIAGLLARMTGRPVKLFLSREETFRCVGNRPAARMTLKGGVRKDGQLTALELVNLASGGAYPSGSDVGFLVADLYTCANVRIEEANVYVNAGKARPMRAPGFPQCAWALEQVMDALAEGIGMDPVGLRLRNVPSVSQFRRGQPFTTTGLRQCLEEGAKAFGWDEARARARGDGAVRRGVGVAACLWGWGGGPPATAIVRLLADGSVNLATGASDIGTGTKTVLAMVVAEELGVPLDRIQIEHADTATSPYAPSSGGSQTVVCNAPPVRAAAIEVKRQLLEIAAAELKRPPETLSLEAGKVVPRDEPDKAVALGALEGLRQRRLLVGVGHRGPNPAGKIANPFAAQFAEVEVNVETGEVRVLRLLGAHDSGRVMNRLTYRNQVFGGMTMGVGFAMTEKRILDRATGKVVNANWHDYKIPTALDVPAEPRCVPVDLGDRECNTTGAKGLGEPATVPTAAAIANAVYHATGVRVTETPIGPAQMVRLLAEHQGRG